MATEVGSDIALIQDEDMLRKMWQQTEDFGKKKEIRMRMYKLREQRLKEFYTTGEMIQTETTSKRSSTRTHTESITDQGFMTMKTKEIRDSESPTEDYQQQTNNKNYYVSSKSEESDGIRGIVQTELNKPVKLSEEYTPSSLQTSVSSSASSKWESSRTIISVSEEVQKADVNLSSKFIINEQNNENRQLTYDISSNKNDVSNIDSKIAESITTTNVDSTKRENNSQYLNDHQKSIETYTNITNNEKCEPVSENVLNKNSTYVDNTYTSDLLTNKTENINVTTNKNTINELQQLDSYSSNQQPTTDLSTKLNSTMSNEEKIPKTIDEQVTDLSKENTEGQYTTTYQHSYQQPRISVDLSPSHEAFARSLRSTPERSSPSPNRERMSPDRRFKSVSPEKYRASPEKSVSPPKSFKSSTRRKLSSTHTKDLSKKRANTPTRGEKYDSSDDSDCSGETHGTYDKYKGFDSKRTQVKEDIKISSVVKYNQKSPSTSPVRREKSPGYSSEGSVGKEIKKSTRTKNSSHESSPERSAFKRVHNYRTHQTEHVTQDNKINIIAQEENIYSDSSKNNVIDVNNFIKVIKPEVEDNLKENTVSNIQNNVDISLDSKARSTQENFIIEEKLCTSSEQVDNINKISRENSPPKILKKENKLSKENFIKNEKLNIVNESIETKDIITVKSKEKSPVKELKPVSKNSITHPTYKLSEKISNSPNNKSKNTTISSIPSSIKKSTPSSLEKTPSKKSILHKDSKESISHKTLKKDISREKVDVKMTRNDSKTLIHKNSKESITPKTIDKKPSQELLINKKTTISSRNKITSPETKPKTQEPTKVIEKKDSKSKLKPSISPQSSQKKLGIVKSSIQIKTNNDSKKTTETTHSNKIPSTNITKPKIYTPAMSNTNDITSKGTKLNAKVISTSVTTKSQIKRTIPSNLNKTTKKVEVTKNLEVKPKDLEDELPPDNFESDTDLDDSNDKSKYIKNNSSNSSTSSSSSSDDEDEDDKQKIKELNNIRVEAEKEYGKKMTNKDALLNVIVQLPPSSRESSPEYSTRFGQPYCSVSDDASLPRYADVVSEPEDVNDYRLHRNRYDIVTDLDEESNVTVADRVSKFLNNVNRQDEIKTTEIPQSPQAVRKTKQLFESIAKGQIEVTDNNDDVSESEPINIEVHDTPKNINTQSSLLTRKISGASDYKTRKEFFEKKTFENTLNDTPEKIINPKKVTRSSSIKDRRDSFEAKSYKKTPLKDKTNVPRTRSPESKNSSPDRTAKSQTKVIKTEILDVKIEELNKSRRLSGPKTVKDRTATFEKNEATLKSVKENKNSRQHQVTNSNTNTNKFSEVYSKSSIVSNTSKNESPKRMTSPNRTNRTKTSPERTVTEVYEITTRKVSSKSPDRKATGSPDRKTAKSPERSKLNTREDISGNHRVYDTSTSSKQHIITDKTQFGTTIKNTTAPKNTLTTTKSTSCNNTDDEMQIEEIFDLEVLEIMLEKAVGYDRRRRIRAQIRVVKRQLESKGVKEINTIRVSKNVQDVSPAQYQKQKYVTVEKTECVKKTEAKNKRSISPQKSYTNQTSSLRTPSPQKTLRSVEETRSPSPQKTTRPVEKVRSPSPQKMTRLEKVRAPSPQKTISFEKARSPSPKKKSVVNHQEESILNKYEKSSRNLTTTTTSTTVTTTTKVKSEQVSSNVFQEQNVTDLITSSYGVGPTDDNGRPLFGLRALRKTNTSQSIHENDSYSQQVDSRSSVPDQNGRPLFGLKALQNDNKYTVQESKTVNQKFPEQKGGVDQLITDHKGKPLFGLKALQSIGKNEESIYEDMPEPPVSPQLKELVLKHEKHAKESSKLDAQPRQKPKAKFRDSFILDTKDEGLYSTFQQNGYSDPNSITLRSIIKKPVDDQNNETIVKSKSQSTVFQSKSVMRSDGSGNVSVTQDFFKGEVSSVNDQEPSGKLTQGHYTYQSPDSEKKQGIAKVTTVTTTIGKDAGRDSGPEITEITEEFNNTDRVDSNKVVKRSRINDKFESIQKRFSQESFDQDSRRSSRETNGFERTTEESSQSTPRSSLVRGDSIKALQHKFQQATVSSSLKQNRSVKSDSSSNVKESEEKTGSTKVNTSRNSGATSFLDNSSRVTGVQDVLTRMRNADLVVESGDTNEDIEARALLNKFLGASVILHGMEQGAKSPTSSPITTTTTSSAALVNQVEKQRTQKSPVIRNNLNEQELDNIWDEKQLKILLESCPDYDQRRKIRARLRQIMAEHKACADIVALANTDGTTNHEKNEVTESNSTSVSSKTEGSSYVKTEVHTRTTTSSNRLTKANSISSSPFAKFQQLERQNSAPNSQSRPCYKFTDPALARSASSIKDRLLSWVKAQTKEYKNLQITNFSTSWSDGLAFCALIHHFYPEAFDYDKLKPENRRENFEIAFRVAEDEAGIVPLLDVEDMVVMRKPDWKCVFTYVQTFYRRFHNTPQADKPSF